MLIAARNRSSAARARHFVGGDDVCVLLADNIFEFSIRRTIERFERQGGGSRVLLTRAEHPEHYGVPVLVDGRIERIEEKPLSPASPYAVTGCYLYDNAVFELAKGLEPSARGEVEITDVNNSYARQSRLQFDILYGYWADCGESFRSLLRANALAAENGANKAVPEDAAR